MGIFGGGRGGRGAMEECALESGSPPIRMPHPSQESGRSVIAPTRRWAGRGGGGSRRSSKREEGSEQGSKYSAEKEWSKGGGSGRGPGRAGHAAQPMRSRGQPRKLLAGAQAPLVQRQAGASSAPAQASSSWAKRSSSSLKRATSAAAEAAAGWGGRVGDATAELLIVPEQLVDPRQHRHSANKPVSPPPSPARPRTRVLNLKDGGVKEVVPGLGPHPLRGCYERCAQLVALLWRRQAGSDGWQRRCKRGRGAADCAYCPPSDTFHPRRTNDAIFTPAQAALPTHPPTRSKPPTRMRCVASKPMTKQRPFSERGPTSTTGLRRPRCW